MMHLAAFVYHSIAGVERNFSGLGISVLHPDWPRLAVASDVHRDGILARRSIYVPLKLIALNVHPAVGIRWQ
jgi:hypothetical protein